MIERRTLIIAILKKIMEITVQEQTAQNLICYQAQERNFMLWSGRNKEI